ncbi:MAG: magnesium transporter, partial [Verrucomicrobiales bacterium]|nr:magnesium transporter [Verrucomicrobiales bacterium]
MSNAPPVESQKPVEIEKIVDAFDSSDEAKIVAICREAHPGDVEEAFERLDEPNREAILNFLPVELIAELGDYLPAADMEKRLQTLPEEDQAEVLDSMSDDELVDLLQEVDEEERRSDLIELLPEEKQVVSEELLQFEEETAGGRMTTAMAKIHEDETVGEVLQSLREKKEDTEILSRIYVVDGDDRLLGKVRLRDLAFSPEETRVLEVADRDLTAIEARADQEEAAQMVARYDLLALPVVDADGRLLGVITHDDAIDILEKETTEDMERIGGIGGERGDLAYLQTSVTGHVKRRFWWVLVLAFLALASGIIMFAYEDTLKAYFVLAIYLPMVIAAGGNTGGQSATMIIRAMSLGELGPQEFRRVIFKEMRIGMILGGLLGIFVALQIQFLLPDGVVDEGISVFRIAIVVGLSLLAQITTSTLFGAILPIGARAAKLDPAVV